MTRSRVVSTVLFAALTLRALQIDTPAVAPEMDMEDLYQRAVESEVVVIGRVVRVEGVQSRESEAERQKRLHPGKTPGTVVVSLDGVVGGAAIAIQVETTVCRAADFSTTGPVSPAPNRALLHLFVPRDEPLWSSGRQRESFVQGRLYLLFLVPVEVTVQRQWKERFELPASTSLYRAHERSRGVVMLDPDERPLNPVLDKIGKLCAAVKPPGLARKIAALRRLQASGDLILQQQATLAVRGLQESKQ